MNAATLLHGQPADAAAELDQQQDPSARDLALALSNALYRIDTMQRQIQHMQATLHDQHQRIDTLYKNLDE